MTRMFTLSTVLITFLFQTKMVSGAFLPPESYQRLPDLLPTTYYIADEEHASCKGRYRGVEYNGDERSQVLTPNGDLIAEVCTRFFKILCMEGTGVLNDRGQGRITVNWASNSRFSVMEKCIYGMGVDGLCLIPYHTLAADLAQYKVNSLVYIPRVKGLTLPDGKIHSGYFLVRDTGGAFRGIGKQRVDMFTAFEHDGDNTFSRAGFHHRTPEEAYLVTGPEKEKILNQIKDMYPEIF